MTNEQLDHDGDPRLTAYALGELVEAECAEISARLAESLDERRLVDETQRLGGLLRQTMRAQPATAAASDLRAAVLQQLAEPAPAGMPRPRPRVPRRRYWLPLSLAASLLAISGTLYALLRTRQHERLVAQNDFIVSAPDRSHTALGMDEPMAVNADPNDLLDESAGGTINSLLNDNETRGETTELAPQSEFEQVRRPRGGLVVETGAAAKDGDQDLLTDDARIVVRGRGTAQKPISHPTEPGSDGPALAEDLGGIAEQQKVSEGENLSRIQKQLDVQNKRLERINQLAKSAALSSDFVKEELAKKEALEQALAGGTGQGMTGGMGIEARHADASIIYNETPNSGAANIGDRYAVESSVEAYAPIIENPFLNVTEHPLSTFSIDVDTASYANVRRFLSSHALPPPPAVRIEEMINYFQYDYPQPDGPEPFSVTTEVARCPWNAEHRLLRIGLKGRDVAAERRPASNLVFLLDVSGSMEAPNKLPLVKEAMQLLTEKLTENDRVAIVVYAGNSGLVLPSTNGDNKEAICSAIAGLIANGSTNGGQGLQMAYDVAQSRFIKGGTNRVILATDGDFNVGLTSHDELVRLIEAKAKSGVFLSALGFGVGNLKDSTLEKLADKGNGNYAYIDTLGEARKVLVEQLSGTLVTIAKDVKLQIEFNPAQVGEFRLIGYEDRMLAHQDFNDDRKDAGDVGAGHTVTALYELSPSDRAVAGGVPLKYQSSKPPVPAVASDELATIKLRYKEPDGDESRLHEHVVAGQAKPDAAASGDLQFASAVAAFGMLLRDSAYRGEANYEMVLELAQPGLAHDANGYRSEFVRLVREARGMKRP